MQIQMHALSSADGSSVLKVWAAISKHEIKSKGILQIILKSCLVA